MIELTERGLVDEPQRAATTVRALRDRDTGIAVDNYGTASSSLNHLRTLPVEALKIDRSLVSGLVAGGYDAAMVGAICTIASALGIRVVAEGVESADQLASVRSHGCDLAQGFHFAPPLEPAAFVDFVRDGPSW